MQDKIILDRYMSVMPYATAKDFERFTDVVNALGVIGAFVALELSLMALNSK